MDQRLLKVIAAALGVLLLTGLAVFVGSGPQQPADEAVSATWLQPGPYSVGQAEFTFVDASRRTMPNRDAPGLDQRRFPTTLWYPLDYAGQSLPLIIHSHGILSSRAEMPYLMEALASQGFVVAASDYPLTSGSSPGGANARDVVNQPADISFLLDSMLALGGDRKPFNAMIDTDRIGLSGYSLGGLTTFLASYHAELRDPRVDAATAIAGPSAVFSPVFFDTVELPFLALAGTADALIDYQGNARDLPQRADDITVVAIAGGSHLGFVGAAEPTFRFMHNPDSLGCSAVLSALGDSPNAVFDELGTAAIGVDTTRELPAICDDETLPEAMHPGRQHMITQVAVVSFFVSRFSPDRAQRELAASTLDEELSRDFNEVELTAVPLF